MNFSNNKWMAGLESMFSAHGRYFPLQICTLGKTALASPPHITWHIFQVYFSNSACFIGCCMHGSLLVHGRSSACTTYFPVWVYGTESSQFRGCSIWSSLPNGLKLSDTLQELKRRMKQWDEICCNCRLCKMFKDLGF